MVMKKHVIPNFSFYIYKKNIQKTHKMKKKLNIKLIFYYHKKIIIFVILEKNG